MIINDNLLLHNISINIIKMLWSKMTVLIINLYVKVLHFTLEK